MADIFISYSSKDRTFVESLQSFLLKDGFTVWTDSETDQVRSIITQTDEELEQSRCVVALWSSRSVKSDWVKAESQRAFDCGKLIVVKIEKNLRIPLPFNTLLCNDLSDWDLKSEPPNWNPFVESIRSFINNRSDRVVSEADRDQADDALENLGNVHSNSLPDDFGVAYDENIVGQLIYDYVLQNGGRVPCGKIAYWLLNDVLPDNSKEDWLGAGSFKNFFNDLEVENLELDPNPPGFIQVISEFENQSWDDLLKWSTDIDLDIFRILEIPKIIPAEYLLVYEYVAEAMNRLLKKREGKPRINPWKGIHIVSKEVSETLLAEGNGISRTTIKKIIWGALKSKEISFDPGATIVMKNVAIGFLKSQVRECEKNGIELDQNMVDSIATTLGIPIAKL